MRPLLFLIFAGCRPDAGAPVYPDPSPYDPTAADPDFYGDDPYTEGDARLSLGLFYEGGASVSLPVDDTTRHFYVYESSFAAVPSDDRVEGYVSDSLEPSGGAWWGGGVHWDVPEDLSAWDTLVLSLKSRDPAMAGMALGMNGGGTEARVTVDSLGFVADGTWQRLTVPLQHFVDGGVDLAAVGVPLLVAGEGAAGGTSVLIDDLYFTQSGTGTEAPTFLGDDPYVEGEARLSLGVFYEGGASEAFEIDGETRHFYIFSNTFTVASSDDRVEGYVADRIETGTAAWWGGSVTWDRAEDLSAWTTLHVALKSADPGMEAAALGMTGGTEARLPLSTLGFVADGAWHHLEVPLADFADAGADLTQITVPLLLVSEDNTAGDQLLIDDLYLTAED